MSDLDAVRVPTANDETDGPSTTYEPGFVYLTVRSTPFWMTVVLLVIAVGFGALSGGAFLRPSNIIEISLAASEVMLLAVGVTLILAAGELDLSIGANLVLSSVVAAGTIQNLAGTPEQIVQGQYPNLVPAVIAGVCVALITGSLLGLTNGLLVTRLGMSSFIVTLGTTGVFTGLAYVLTNGVDFAYLPRDLQYDFGMNRLVGVIPFPVLVVLGVAGVLWFAMRFTGFGVETLAIGSSREAAVRAGIRVNRHIVVLFTLMGLLSGIASLIAISRFGTTNIAGHQTDNLAAIAAAVIGGTSLFGGQASIGGAIVGSLIPAALATGLIILGVASFYQLIAVGTILIIAVYVDQRRRRQLT